MDLNHILHIERYDNDDDDDDDDDDFGGLSLTCTNSGKIGRLKKNQSSSIFQYCFSLQNVDLALEC